ncbi:MAG TPA: serine hydrolase domain-containing protein [Caulobacteraceae bacterium]|nr:serine hydrolase domain-containing protein [Caulobacteraceae bacterium]
MAGTHDLTAAYRLDPRPWVADEDGPGAVAAVLSGGQVRSWVSRGRAGIGGAPALSPQTVFYIASLSKQFTAVCVARCETDGRLDIDASVRAYIPELPALFDPITPKMLLHHLGGLPHGRVLRAAPEIDGDWWDGLGLWDLIAVLAREPELAPPGEGYVYSNCGYWLLAACVERVSGQSFAAFARQRLFEPLGMAQSRFRDNPDMPQPSLALGHKSKDGRFEPVQTRFHGVGDGGLLTNLDDLAKWDVFWSGRSALGDALPARLLEQGVRNDGRRLYYAWGVSVRSHRGTPSLSHSGGYIGYLTRLVRFPEHDFSVACVANTDHVDVDGFAMAVADAVLGDTVDQAAPSWGASVRDDALAP